jgi:hypothetical protein
MRSLIVEEPMKREWQISRTTIAHPNGQQRWDQAYQLLLRWAQAYPPAAATPLPAPPSQEVTHASSALRTGVDEPPSPTPDD